MGQGSDDVNEPATTGLSVARVLAAITASLVAGVFVGAIYAAMPAPTHKFGVGPAIMGAVAGYLCAKALASVGWNSRLASLSLGLAASLVAFGTYAFQSVRTFEAYIALESDEAKAARKLVMDAAESDSTSLGFSTTRWLIWRAKPFGIKDEGQALLLAAAELACCGIAGAISASLLRTRSISLSDS